MGMVYKVDVLKALQESGYSTYRLRKERLLSESTIHKLRYGIGVSWDNIETICRLIGCQPGDILEYSDEPEQKED